MVLDQLPADPSALAVLVGALGWALTELRAHRKHRAEIDRERVDLEKDRLQLEKRQAQAAEDAAARADQRIQALEQQARAQDQIANRLESTPRTNGGG